MKRAPPPLGDPAMLAHAESFTDAGRRTLAPPPAFTWKQGLFLAWCAGIGAAALALMWIWS